MQIFEQSTTTRNGRQMHYMDSERDDHDMNTHETIDMDSSGSHCLKLESFIAKRRAKI